MPATPTMNFQAYLEDSYRIIRKEPLILILGGFIVQLLTILSLGLLAGPFMGGYLLLIIYYLRDNRKPTFNDIFSGLQRIGALFPYFLVLLLIFIGLMLLILPGLLFATWWLYVLPLMVDRKLPFVEAMRLSMHKVNESGFFMHFVFLLLISVIPMMLLNFLSAMIPVLMVLKILLPPFQAGCLASLYIDKFGSAESADIQDVSPGAELAQISTGQLTDSEERASEVEEDGPAAEVEIESGGDEKQETDAESGQDGEKKD